MSVGRSSWGYRMGGFDSGDTWCGTGFYYAEKLPLQNIYAADIFAAARWRADDKCNDSSLR